MKMLSSMFLLLAAAFALPADDVKFESDAALLLQEGRQAMQLKKYERAKLAFRTLIAVYPESTLVADAQEAIRAADQLEQKSQRPALLVASLQFTGIGDVTADEILKRFQEREVRLAAGVPYSQRDVEEARRVLLEFLAEKGAARHRVRVIAKHAVLRRVAVRFVAY